MEDYNDMDMDTNYNDIAGIEAYLDGTLNGEALKQFQQWRTNDPESEKKIAAHKLIRIGMEGLAHKTYRAQVDTWERDIQEDDSSNQEEDGESQQSQYPKSKTFPWLTLAVAASFMLILLIGGRWYIGTQYESKQLALTNYEGIQQDNIKGIRDVLPDSPEEWADCENAIPALKTIPPESEKYREAQYTLGHCLFEQQEYLAAAEAFQIALGQGKEGLEAYEQAYWSRILALLASEQVSDEELIKLLDQLPPNTNQGLRSRANRLKSDLESVWRGIVR